MAMLARHCPGFRIRLDAARQPQLPFGEEVALGDLISTERGSSAAQSHTGASSGTWREGLCHQGL